MAGISLPKNTLLVLCGVPGCGKSSFAARYFTDTGYRKRFEHYIHPAGRKAVFLGDLTDRGPRSLDSFWLVKAMVDSGNAYPETA